MCTRKHAMYDYDYDSIYNKTIFTFNLKPFSKFHLLQKESVKKIVSDMENEGAEVQILIEIF